MENLPQYANILVVDDTPENLRVLVQLLQKQGYRVRPVRNGAHALMSAQKEPPDLILLDIRMPDMDGYEVCQQLKADERTCDIPIIFISALDEGLDKAAAFSAGGVDYLTKPFQTEELIARVQTHLALHQMRQALQEKNALLKKQNTELDAFAHTVAHDLQNPLTILMGYAQILQNDPASITTNELAIIGESSYKAAQKAIDIIQNLLLLVSVRKEDVKQYPLDMADIIKQVLERLNWSIVDTQAELILPKTWPAALGYAPWVEEVWVNYISNGLKYGGQPPRLEFGATLQADDTIRFWVQDNGLGMSANEQAILFTEFTRLGKLHIKGHGLGLSIVRRIMAKLDGQAGVESEPGQGSRFFFTLKANPS
ncbi:MAG: hybrid sensor histidine kinase/response regulator [Anaerolineaceae bacterium]|nr:hybrid sensor histidine kinase/response regulator [Anaerolineaceae bacterium]MCB9099628.1 hybrid sensor histidine kinase/response regulator [Anaerolineales bacterium]